MDATPERFAHRCLPLSIANAAGWEILNPHAFSAIWNGGKSLDSISIKSKDGEAPAAESHFGSGVLTFRIPGLFETPPGVVLWIGGSPNHLKDGIQPLTGMVETSWSPYTFTMNWKFTRSGRRIHFDAGEPFGFIFPLDLDLIEAVEPSYGSFDDNPKLGANYLEWSQSRSTFNEDLKQEDSDARRQKWQKTYHRGVKPDGSKAEADHRTKMKLKRFEAKDNMPDA